jgi:hypothetical protein
MKGPEKMEYGILVKYADKPLSYSREFDARLIAREWLTQAQAYPAPSSSLFSQPMYFNTAVFYLSVQFLWRWVLFARLFTCCFWVSVVRPKMTGFVSSEVAITTVSTATTAV